MTSYDFIYAQDDPATPDDKRSVKSERKGLKRSRETDSPAPAVAAVSPRAASLIKREVIEVDTAGGSNTRTKRVKAEKGK